MTQWEEIFSKDALSPTKEHLWFYEIFLEFSLHILKNKFLVCKLLIFKLLYCKNPDPIRKYFTLYEYMEYGSTGFGVFKWGYKIRKVFTQESTYSKEIIEF